MSNLSHSQVFTLTTMLTEEEGFRAKPYRCTANKLTIGVGRNLEDRGISKEEAMYLLGNDIEFFGTELAKRLPYLSRLDEIRQIVLIDMAFNLGINNLLAFKNTLKLVEQGKYKEAAVEMLNSKWANQVGRRAIRLSKMMETGNYQEM